MFWKKSKIKKNDAINERRKFPRFAQQLSLKLRVRDTDFRAVTLDISHGGLRIESPEKITPGSIVYFKPDDTTSHNISGIGEVKWCKPSTKPNFFEFGIASYFNTTQDMMDWLPGSA